jgi:hypothetical protein
MVPVTLIGKGSRRAETFALVDSGADTTMLHARWLKKLGLVLEAGRQDTRGGIRKDESTKVYVHRIGLIVGNATLIRCEVAFSEEIGDEVTDQLIGREVVFDRLRFAFRQRIEMLYLNPEK